jgi:hypothetical protein
MMRSVVLICFVLAYLASASAYLSTDGRFIVDTRTGKRVKLKCVNWYGAHQELYSVGGLERQSIRNITMQIVRMKSNCVRLPLSIDLVYQNPPVLRSTIAAVDPAECPGLDNIRGMDLLDCVVYHLTDNGIMVILNNHASRAAWVGANTRDKQGLWNMPGYPTQMWIDSLYNISARYRDNPLVVGVDIRNEIHDQACRASASCGRMRPRKPCCAIPQRGIAGNCATDCGIPCDSMLMGAWFANDGSIHHRRVPCCRAVLQTVIVDAPLD